MNEHLSMAHEPRLLDAHSFVWIVGEEVFINWIPNREKCLKEVKAIEKEIQEKDIGVGREAYSYVKTRLNQGPYRKELLKRYSSCVLCGMDFVPLLTASHIKPWAVCEDSEKTDRDNGFILCPDHDAMFDNGYISIDDKGHLLISRELSDENRVLLNVNENMRIDLTEGNRKYLNYHRKNIYK